MTDPPVDPAAAMQAYLRDLGQPVDPAAAMQEYLRDLGQAVHTNPTVSQVQQPAEGEAKLVVVDRVLQDASPGYCVHGYAECYQCREPCWLGEATYRLVTQEGVAPICMSCARSDLAGVKPVGHVDDPEH